MNGKNCAWIVSGMQYSASERFPLMPQGQLSRTFKDFHPARLDKSATNYSETPTDKWILVKADAFGGTVERRFEKLRNGGLRPASLGKFTSTFEEKDPIFGAVSLKYQADATTQHLNGDSRAELEGLEKRLQTQIVAMTSPLKAQELADLLNGHEEVSGDYKINVAPGACNDESPEDDQFGCQNSLWNQPTDESIFQKYFQYGLAEALDVQLSVVFDKTAHVLRINGEDDEGIKYALTFEYSPDDDEYSFPIRVKSEITYYRISLAMEIQFKTRLSIPEMLEAGARLAEQAGEEKLQSDALWAKAGTRYADGYSKKRTIDGEPQTIFTARAKAPFNGRVFYELVPFELQIPDYFEINGRLFQVVDKFPLGRRFALIDVNTGKTYRGTIRIHDIAHPHLLDITNYVVSMPEEILKAGTK